MKLSSIVTLDELIQYAKKPELIDKTEALIRNGILLNFSYKGVIFFHKNNYQYSAVAKNNIFDITTNDSIAIDHSENAYIIKNYKIKLKKYNI